VKTALVLSAGGMYGAYQAGAWKALSAVFQPDLVVGASIGALNGWAIAGGCDPGELIHRWLTLDAAARYRWTFPNSIFGGVLDAGPLRSVIRQLHSRFQPRSEFALVVTDLLKLEPRLIMGDQVTWQHLAASTAIVGIFDQLRLDDGRLYSDGGLLSALPVWAAAQLGAQRIIAINVLPKPPGMIARGFVAAMRMLAPTRPPYNGRVELVTIMPKLLLGSPLESLYWKRARAEAWIQQGEQDANAALALL
jgi:NTE family protein